MRWLQDAGMPFWQTPLGTVDGFSRNKLMAIAGATGIGRMQPRALLGDLRLVERGMHQALAARKQR